MEICNKHTNLEPDVQAVLGEIETVDDLDRAIDITIQHILRIIEREKVYRSEVKQNGKDYIPIYSSGLSSPRAGYSYLKYNLHEQFYDHRKMLLESLWLGIPTLTGGSDISTLNVRLNFGVVPLPSVFDGIELGVSEDVMPWVSNHLSTEETVRFMHSFNPDCLIEKGIFPLVMERVAYFKDKLNGTGIGVVDINNQGIFDIAHLIRGSDIFYDIFDDPSFVHELMELCIVLYIEGYKQTREAIGIDLHGGVAYCDDSSTLLSADTFEEFSLPYVKKAVEPFDFMNIHYCGKGHLLEYYLQIPKVKYVNLGQPELHCYEEFIQKIISYGKGFNGLWPPLPEDKTAGEYFSRMLKQIDGTSDVLNLWITGYEFEMNSKDLCKLWYEVQDEILTRN